MTAADAGVWRAGGTAGVPAGPGGTGSQLASSAQLPVDVPSLSLGGITAPSRYFFMCCYPK